MGGREETAVSPKTRKRARPIRRGGCELSGEFDIITHNALSIRPLTTLRAPGGVHRSLSHCQYWRARERKYFPATSITGF
jgi:hypothetical protein